MYLKSLTAFVALSLLSACAALPFGGGLLEAPAPAPEVDRDVTTFEVAIDEGRYAEAVAGLRPVVKAHPDHTEAKLLLATAHLAQADIAPAYQLFTEVNEETGSPTDQLAALNGMGIAELYQGDIVTAEATFREALTYDEGSSAAWNGLAQSLDRQNRRDEAEAAAREAVALAPEWQAAQNNLGLILLHGGKFEEAEQTLGAAYALDDASQVIANNLRLTIAMQGRYQEALAGIEPAAEPDALNNVGYAALVRGDLGAADQFLRQAVETSPRYHERAHDNLRFLASLKQQAGNSI